MRRDENWEEGNVWGILEGCEEVEDWSKNGGWNEEISGKGWRGGGMSLASRQKCYVVSDKTTCEKKGYFFYQVYGKATRFNCCLSCIHHLNIRA